MIEPTPSPTINNEKIHINKILKIIHADDSLTLKNNKKLIPIIKYDHDLDGTYREEGTFHNQFEILNGVLRPKPLKVIDKDIGNNVLFIMKIAGGVVVFSILWFTILFTIALNDGDIGSFIHIVKDIPPHIRQAGEVVYNITTGKEITIPNKHLYHKHKPILHNHPDFDARMAVAESVDEGCLSVNVFRNKYGINATDSSDLELDLSSVSSSDHSIEGLLNFIKNAYNLCPNGVENRGVLLVLYNKMLPYTYLSHADTKEIKQERLGIDENKVAKTVHKHGNTSAASIPLAFYDSLKSGKLDNVKNIAFCGFGAGLSWGSIVMKIR